MSIESTIKEHQQNKWSSLEIVRSLLHHKFSKSEIMAHETAIIKKAKIRPHMMSLLYVGYAILVGFTTRNAAPFRYRLSSPKDYFLLSEWVIKPSLMLVFFFLGIMLFINKGYFSKNAKSLLILLMVSFTICSMPAGDAAGVGVGVLGLILVCITTVFEYSGKSDLNMILGGIDNGQPDKLITKNLGVKEWRGSAFGILLFFLAVLLAFNSGIRLSTLSNSEYKLTVELLLGYSLRALSLTVLIAAVLLYINRRRFSFILYLLGLQSFIHVVLCLVHIEFQRSLIPAATLLGALTYCHLNPNIPKSINGNYATQSIVGGIVGLALAIGCNYLLSSLRVMS